MPEKKETDFRLTEGGVADVDADVVVDVVVVVDGVVADADGVVVDGVVVVVYGVVSAAVKEVMEDPCL